MLCGRLLRARHPRISRLLITLAPWVALDPLTDLVENAFSLLMIADIKGFPAWWALAHGTASRLKLVASVAAGVVGPTLVLAALIAGRPTRVRSDAEEPALPPR